MEDATKLFSQYRKYKSEFRELLNELNEINADKSGGTMEAHEWEEETK